MRRMESFYCTHFFREWDFCWRDFNSCRGLFSYSLVFGMDIGSLHSPKPETFIFIKKFPGNKHFGLANQSQIILYSSTTDKPIKCADLRLWESILSSYQILIGHPIKPQYKRVVNKRSQPTHFHVNQKKKKSKIWLIYEKIWPFYPDRWARDFMI